MSLEALTCRRVCTKESSGEKPHVEGVEHANLDRPGAHLHPRARASVSPVPVQGAGGWRDTAGPRW